MGGDSARTQAAVQAPTPPPQAKAIGGYYGSGAGLNLMNGAQLQPLNTNTPRATFLGY